MELGLPAIMHSASPDQVNATGELTVKMAATRRKKAAGKSAPMAIFIVPVVSVSNRLKVPPINFYIPYGD